MIFSPHFAETAAAAAPLLGCDVYLNASLKWLIVILTKEPTSS